MKEAEVVVKINGEMLEDIAFNMWKPDFSLPTHDVKCPHCNADITVCTGKIICPVCKNVVHITMLISFK